ncbi:hypothetical protein EDC01DRAFT_732191, partial [Geopyxis carbonaria]
MAPPENGKRKADLDYVESHDTDEPEPKLSRVSLDIADYSSVPVQPPRQARFSCGPCHRYFKDVKAQEDHFLYSPQHNQHLCCISCDLVFHDDGRLRQHAQSGECALLRAQPLHSCNVCIKIFQDAHEMSRHAKSKAHMSMLWRCDECGLFFRSLKEKREHMKDTLIHTWVNDPWWCQFCRRGYASKEALNEHYRTSKAHNGQHVRGCLPRHYLKEIKKGPTPYLPYGKTHKAPLSAYSCDPWKQRIAMANKRWAEERAITSRKDQGHRFDEFKEFGLPPVPVKCKRMKKKVKSVKPKIDPMDMDGDIDLVDYGTDEEDGQGSQSEYETDYDAESDNDMEDLSPSSDPVAIKQNFAESRPSNMLESGGHDIGGSPGDSLAQPESYSKSTPTTPFTFTFTSDHQKHPHTDHEEIRKKILLPLNLIGKARVY